jgi:hypothetical protein
MKDFVIPLITITAGVPIAPSLETPTESDAELNSH